MEMVSLTVSSVIRIPFLFRPAVLQWRIRANFGLCQVITEVFTTRTATKIPLLLLTKENMILVSPLTVVQVGILS